MASSVYLVNPFSGGGGTATPGGSDTQVQFNNAGAFGGFGLWSESLAQFRIGALSDVDTVLQGYVTDGPSVVGIGETKSAGYIVGVLGISSSATEDAYGMESVASVTGTGSAIGTEAAGLSRSANTSAIGVRAWANADGTGSAPFNVTELFSLYTYRPFGVHGATNTTGYHLWMEGGSDPAVTANMYFVWADAQGVYRIREDFVADGSGNPQAIPALYNPRFTKYTPGAANYERGVQQWVANVFQIGAEAGGTGTTRGVQVIGASVDLPAFAQMTEVTAPSAGAANTVRIYAEDDGGGKTRLMALFSSGAAQQIAIQP